MTFKKSFPTLYKKTATGAAQCWTIRVEVGVKDAGILITTYGQVGGKMQEARDTITEGKNAGKKNATTALQQALSEAESRWNKQKDRKGYGLTADESAEIRSLSPMLAQPYDKHAKKVNWSDAFAQPKFDGFRCLMRMTRDGKVTMTSRENQPFTALESIQAEVAKAAKRNVEHEVILDGELYCHGMSLNEIASACKKKSSKTDLLRYHVYDTLLDANFSERHEFVAAFLEEMAQEFFRPVYTVKVRNETELMHCQAEFMDGGYEGAMLRHTNKAYEAGKRSQTLLKVKTFQDAEFKVVDFKSGRGKYADCAIFVCTTKDDNHFEVTAPGTLEDKRQFLTHAKKYIGKMLTVKFIYYTKTDTPVPFLPVGVAFRSMGKLAT